MKANETNLLKFLQGSKQFIIPIYQRKYSWDIKQCEQLWQDIERVALNEDIKAHFIGSVVYVERGIYNVSAVPQLLVIDGQQRLTTLSLMLLALHNSLRERSESISGGITSKKLKNYYLVNSDEEGELYHRLILTKSDKETLMALIEDRIPQEVAVNVQRNYEYFVGKIQSMKMSMDDLYQGLSKLIMVDIALDRENDNPQLIFESLNSTGLDLSQADLIRNYLLMGLEPKVQEDLYNRYWLPIEKRFGNLSDAKVFDRFMRDYLTVKTERIPNIRNIYQDFKEYIMQHDDLDISDILKDMHLYSNYYSNIVFLQEPNPNLNEALKNIDALKVDVSHPFLLQVYKDYDEKILSETDFLTVLRLVESYVFRRAICGVPTNSLNKTFVTLIKEINKDLYVESLEVALVQKTSYRRFPDDAEFMRELQVKDVYNFRNRNYLLRRLENSGRKEIIDIDAYTIEHIMPQNEDLSDDWQKELGENWKALHENLLHTIGNLTLTRYNSELSDKPFSYKKTVEGGFNDSPLRLNRSVARQTVWNKQSIEKRANVLVEKARTIWFYPNVTEEMKNIILDTKKKSPKSGYTLESYEHMNGATRDLYEELRKRIENIDSSVRVEYTKLYIAFKSITNFADIIPQKGKLRISLNLPYNEINDPMQRCRDVTNIGRWGNGDVEVSLKIVDELPYIITLIQQAFDYQMEK
ncbi:hypothetical protein BME96_06180 [Virgibacillus halodenitrificans]|uniref:DUF262 domain-containing protein n=1 Tax=Virgibacillus halodenitrificans TaxID=1482 RepID=A0AAC9NKK3_VIRHA|nr:DUF262 and DUF1524 domain-containing protein [Virgibacillus halodenitrificans]APC47784.1 hypothetical protein BME96_06180 [Virgibacillus halodenitrificans]